MEKEEKKSDVPKDRLCESAEETDHEFKMVGSISNEVAFTISPFIWLVLKLKVLLLFTIRSTNERPARPNNSSSRSLSRFF